MPCYTPLRGYRAREPGPSGKRRIVFKVEDGFKDLEVKVPCGQCIGCRLERSRQWAMRCLHEASLYEANCFITLTYSDECCPADGSLDVRHWQKFMKRLRKRFGANIRFFHCGEYGDKTRRPHYHACLFNFDFPDKVLFKVTKSGHKLYNSKILSDLWPFGYAVIGGVSFESAAYVARYIVKKVTGDGAVSHYERIDPETGEIFTLRPEYTTQSRRPGIASAWFKKFKSDVYPSDFVVVRGVKMRPPKFYDGQFELIDLKRFRRIKGKRKRKAAVHAADNTPDRLRVRERVQHARLKLLPRKLDGES